MNPKPQTLINQVVAQEEDETQNDHLSLDSVVDANH